MWTFTLEPSHPELDKVRSGAYDGDVRRKLRARKAIQWAPSAGLLDPRSPVARLPGVARFRGRFRADPFHEASSTGRDLFSAIGHTV